MQRRETDKRYFRRYYPEATGAYDLYVLFLLQGLKICRDCYTWIIPNKFLVADYARITKEFMLSNGLFRSIDVSSFKIFESASVYPIIIQGSKLNPSPFEEFSLNKYEDLPLRKFLKSQNVTHYNTIGNLGMQVCSGATGFEAQRIKEYVHCQKDRNSIEFTVSGNIDRYTYNNLYVRYMKDKYDNAFIYLSHSIATSKRAMWNNPKIIVAGMTKCIEATYVNNPLAIGVGCYAITSFAGANPLFVLGVLNSKLATHYLRNAFKDKHLAGGYLAINKSTIEELPMIIPSDEEQQPIINLVKNILILKKQNPSADTISIEESIDCFVYDLFGLSDEERSTIENDFN